jgi:glycoprotein endo-alpha-1,2-mannosidase
VLGTYTGKSAEPAPTPTMMGKVFCGYQGWFNVPGDGSTLGWRHWSRGDFEPGNCSIDLWPDVSDLPPEERIETKFKCADGSPAYIFTAHNPTTIKRHFEWMKTYGIDGVFMQRFAGETIGTAILKHRNVVLAACRAGANENGRSYAVMYDLSGLGEGGTKIVIDDWKRLIDRGQITRDGNDKAYLRHNGKPVVSVWGIGFDDGRKYTLEECGKLIDFLKNDPKYGGNCVMIGVPTYWRTAGDDTVKDPALLKVIEKADIVSPWTVGRYSTPEYAGRYARGQLAGDLKWCAERKIDLLPVMFPGFSWHNMNPGSKSDDIPRRRGEFFWAQAVADKKAGATMGYVAMFDEMDEGTAIFKLDPNPPTGQKSIFVNERDVPADHYLWLTGEITRLFRGEQSTVDTLPKRN